MLSLESQIIIRNLEAFDGAHLLLINPMADELHQSLSKRAASIQVFTQDYTVKRHFEGLAQLIYDAWLAPESLSQRPDALVLWQPKSRPHFQMLMRMLDSLLDTQTDLWLVGHKNAGIKTSLKWLKNHGYQAVNHDNARHCSLIKTKTQTQTKAQADDPGKPIKLDDFETWTEASIEQLHLRWCSYPGVFAQGKLDAGTAFLLQHLPTECFRGASQASMSVLDYGCGSGVVGAYLQQINAGLNITGLDSNALALAASKQTNPEQTTVAGDSLDQVSGQYQFIVSNPPFHQGQNQTLDVSLKMIEQAPEYLTAKGELFIVANRFLAYHQPLIETFGQVDILAENGQYRIYHAQKA